MLHLDSIADNWQNSHTALRHFALSHPTMSPDIAIMSKANVSQMLSKDDVTQGFARRSSGAIADLKMSLLLRLIAFRLCVEQQCLLTIEEDEAEQSPFAHIHSESHLRPETIS